MGEIDALRAEVITSGVRFEDLLGDDRWFVDSQVVEIAKKRGLTLDWTSKNRGFSFD